MPSTHTATRCFRTVTMPKNASDPSGSLSSLSFSDLAPRGLEYALAHVIPAHLDDPAVGNDVHETDRRANTSRLPRIVRNRIDGIARPIQRTLAESGSGFL